MIDGKSNKAVKSPADKGKPAAPSGKPQGRAPSQPPKKEVRTK